MTTFKALDSDQPLSRAAVAQAKQDGYVGIGRYLHTLTRQEIDLYTGLGFGVFLVYEMNPSAAAGGAPAGVSDGRTAVAQAKALGAPAGAPIYLATDTDPASLPGGPAGAVPYYAAASAQIRPAGFLTGAYLGAAAVNECLKAHAIDRTFIPAATSWADGSQPLRTDILQGYPSISYVTIDGVECDQDQAGAGAGIWNYHGFLTGDAAPPGHHSTAKEAIDMILLLCDDHPAGESRGQLIAGNTRLPLDDADAGWFNALLHDSGAVKAGKVWHYASLFPLRAEAAAPAPGQAGPLKITATITGAIDGTAVEG